MTGREDVTPAEDERADVDWRFCCLFKEFVTMCSGNKQTRAVCAESYREAGARYEPCAKCRTEIDTTQQHCGNPFGEHRTFFKRRLERVQGRLADFRRYPAFKKCIFVCAYCIIRAKRDRKKRSQDQRILEDCTGKIKDQLQTMGLCKDDVRGGIIQIMKKPYVVLSRMQMNDHWKNRNYLSINNIPEIENYDSSDNNDQRSLCSYDADEEINDCEEQILQDNQYSETYFSDSSLTESRLESTSKNLNSDQSSSLQVNFNIEQNLFTSKVLKNNDSKFRSNIKPFKKRHSLPSVVVPQNKCAKRCRSHSDDSPKKVETTSSLKLTLKRDHVNQEYFISSQSGQLTESRSSVEIVDVSSGEDGTNSNFTSSPSSSGCKALAKVSDSTEKTAESISKLKVDVDKTVPELEINDTRPVNMPVNRNNLENSLSKFLKSKLKRNSREVMEVESKRQKITDNSVAVNINVNITVNPLLEESLQKKQPLELKSSNDNSKVLPKTNICSTFDFFRCNECEDESSISNLNSETSKLKNSYFKKVVAVRNTDPVKPTQEILQVDHNCNIEKEVSKTDNISLEDCEDEELKMKKKTALKIKDKQNLPVNGLKLIFKSLFGDVSDSSDAEEEIFRKRRRKSRENRESQFGTNGSAQSVEKNRSKNQVDVLGTANLGDSRSLKSTATENIEVNSNKTEIRNESLDINSNAEISSIATNDQNVSLPESQKLISNTQTAKQTDSNEISSDKNISEQINELEKSHGSEETNSYTNNNIPEKIDEAEKCHNSVETNSCIADEFSSEDQVMPDYSPTDDQMDLEGGDFEFMSSIQKNKSGNEYSDDEYNNYSDFDVEYDDHKNIEYVRDVELIENHKIVSNNKDLQNATDEKSHFTNNLLHTQEISEVYNTHNLNKLPPFYNEDVTNFVNKNIDVDDDDIVVLYDVGPVSKPENKNNNLKLDKKIKSETVINLDSDEDNDEIEEIILEEETNNKLPNEVIKDSEPIINGTTNNSSIESASEICQLTEPNGNNVEINNAIQITELDDINVSELGFGKPTNKEAESTMTLIYSEENGTATKVTVNANEKPVSSNTLVGDTLEVTLNSSQETTSSTNAFIDNLINNALETSSNPNEKSVHPSTSVVDISENILFSNIPSALIADDLEDNLDLNRQSVSPNALVIDETAGNDDFNPSSLNKLVPNEMVNSDNTITSSVDELNSKPAVRFTGNISCDLKNPNVLQEFNLNREIVAPEEIKSEPGMSVDNNTERQTFENLLEEIQKNTCNLQVQSPLSTSVNKVPEVLNNQSASSNIPSSSILIEVSIGNQEKSADEYDLLKDINVNVDDAVDDLNKKELRPTGTFKCRDINELLEKPANKKTESNDARTSNVTVQITIPSEMPSTTNTNSTINTTHVQNSTSQINQQNNFIIGNNSIQRNVSEPIYIIKPLNQMQGMVNQISSLQVCIPQQTHQLVHNSVHPTNVSQYVPQQMVILNSVQNNQNLSQGNPQTITSTSNNVQNQTGPSLILASSMFTNMFAQQNALPSNLPEPQVPRLNQNITSVVPREPSTVPEPEVPRLNLNIPTLSPTEPGTIYTLPFPLSNNLILPEPFALTPLEHRTSVVNKIIEFRRIILKKIETELNELRKIPVIDVRACIHTLQSKNTLTESVWNIHLKILNLMKCVHAISTTTSKKDWTTILYAIDNSIMKASEIPQMKDDCNIIVFFRINEALKDSGGYKFKDTDECINPVSLELEKLQQLHQTTNSMSVKQNNQFYAQVMNYNKFLKQRKNTHRSQFNSIRPNNNVQSQNVNQNSSVTVMPVNNAIISNNSTDRNSLQKSFLNDAQKKQSILSTSNASVSKNVDKSQTNNTEICITAVGSEKKDANTESILDNLNPTCLKCEKTSEIACSNCLSVGYCSQECQYNHWKEVHYKTCEKHLKGIKFL